MSMSTAFLTSCFDLAQNCVRGKSWQLCILKKPNLPSSSCLSWVYMQRWIKVTISVRIEWNDTLWVRQWHVELVWITTWMAFRGTLSSTETLTRVKGHVYYGAFWWTLGLYHWVFNAPSRAILDEQIWDKSYTVLIRILMKSIKMTKHTLFWLGVPGPTSGAWSEECCPQEENMVTSSSTERAMWHRLRWRLGVRCKASWVTRTRGTVLNRLYPYI